MVKVLLINYEYPPLGGGTAIANEYLVREFKKIKLLKLDVLTSSMGNFREEKLSNNIRLIRLNIGKNNKNIHHQSYWELFRFFLISTYWTMKYRRNYDLIHAFSGLPGSVTAWLSGLPYLISFRGAEEPGYEQRYDWLLKLSKPILKIVYSKAKFLDANSEYLKELVLRSFPKLIIQVINNGVDTKKFFPAKKPVKQSTILCTSRLAERKGVEYLIQAMTLIPRAKLLLVGTGRLEASLKQLVKQLNLNKRIKFLGMIKHSRLPLIYRQAKLFVLPSLSESLSNSLLEALSSGLPTVATNVGGNPEIINFQNGMIAPPSDSRKLAVAIIAALNKAWPKISLKKKFSWKKAAEKYYQIFCKMT